MKQCVEKHIRYEKVLCKNFVKIVALNPTIALFVFVFGKIRSLCMKKNLQICPSLERSLNFEMSFWCPHFLPKTNKNKSTSKGQLISECLFDILNFQKKQ